MKPMGTRERDYLRSGKTGGPGEKEQNLGQWSRDGVLSSTRGRERFALNCLGDPTGPYGVAGEPGQRALV